MKYIIYIGNNNPFGPNIIIIVKCEAQANRKGRLGSGQVSTGLKNITLNYVRLHKVQ